MTMHPYVLQTISNDRIGTLRREADLRRLIATDAGVPADPLSTRLHKRLAALLALVAPLGPQPQPCTC
jgi:hypothetical protein